MRVRHRAPGHRPELSGTATGRGATGPTRPRRRHRRTARGAHAAVPSRTSSDTHGTRHQPDTVAGGGS
ncbi:hypothetical protein [Streptomyces halstedii]|uniref:hypothetical protein n=1 Tax=Streptomyces halstedii TaxID=1944 RepID=UPI0036BD73E2